MKAARIHAFGGSEKVKVETIDVPRVKKNTAPSKLVTPGTDVDVAVLEVDSNKRRISLGLKQTQENTWNAFTANPGTSSVNRLG